MVGSFLVAASSLLAAPDVVQPPSAAVLKEYEAASQTVGRSAEANLKLALWCEQRGLEPEREKHLSMAMIADPDNLAVRSLLGQVDDHGKWRRPDEIAARVNGDPQHVASLDQYRAHRDSTPQRADAQWKLALWCEKNGLPDEARGHFLAVIRLQPNHELARKRLGYKKYGSIWATQAQVAEMKTEAEAQRKANLHWTRELETLRSKLGKSRDRDDVEQRLATVRDPRAVGAILHVFGHAHQKLIAQLLGQIDSPEATKAMALLAVHSPSAETRRIASETLTRRDPRDFVGVLIGFVQDTTRYQVNSVPGQNSPGELIVDGPSAVMHRIYRPTAVLQVPLMPGDMIQYDQYGLPMISRYVGTMNSRSVVASGEATSVSAFRGSQAEVQRQIEGGLTNQNPALSSSALGPQLAVAAQQTAAQQVQNMGQSLGNESHPNAPDSFGRRVRWSSYIDVQTQFRVLIPVGEMAMAARMANEQLQARLAADVMRIDLQNLSVEQANDRVLPILQATTGQNLGADQEGWTRWWADHQGYSLSETPTKPEFFDVVQAAAPVLPSVPISNSYATNGSSATYMHSCFGRGTPVRTLTGSARIEDMKVGDLVLASDVKTGEMTYQPVVAVHHNPPAETFRVDLDGDTLVATGIHRLWKAGTGWVMTRDLKPGDILRTVGGTAVVRRLDPEKVQPVFNLEVAEGHDFFVGESGVLAHDNSLIRPVSEPFDSPGDLAALSRP